MPSRNGVRLESLTYESPQNGFEIERLTYELHRCVL
jgi:hypothetical protein